MRAEAIASLRAIVGDDHLRDELSGPEPPALVASPTTPEAVAETLAWASGEGLAVVVRGGGTKSSWGGGPPRCDLILETGGLDRVLEHEPGDLTCVCESGIRLDRLQERVASAPGHRQRLMLDPPQGGASTMGGLVATRASGPLRSRYGTARDLLLGARFALADGTLARTGGKVVKNVAGYDLDKLLVGSLGTLAVVVEVALRLHPVPEASRWVILEGADPRSAAGFAASLRRAPVAPTIVEALWPEREVLVRLDGSEGAVADQARVVEGLHPSARALPAGAASECEERLSGRPWREPGSVFGVSVPLSAIERLLGLAQGPVRQLSLRATVGVGEVRVDPDPVASSWLRDQAMALGGVLEAHRWPGPGEPPRQPRDPVALELELAVKRALDPRSTLAPGLLPAGVPQ